MQWVAQISEKLTPLGGGAAVNVNFSLICATHCKLREAADAGRFRSDLYYRINGLTLNLPALRERSDFPALVDKLLADLFPGGNLHLAPELLTRLAAYRWPGNLRQLASVLRTAVAMLDPDEERIAWQHLADDLVDELNRPVPRQATQAAPQSLNQLSRQAIEQALADSRGNVSAAARRLGISRQTLYRKL